MLLAEQIRRLIDAPDDGPAAETRVFPPEELTPGAPDLVIFSRDAALNRCGSDDDLLAEVREVFPASMPQLLADFEMAIERGDRKTIRRLAHTLKGSADSLGGKQRHLAAAAWEAACQTSDSWNFDCAWRELQSRINQFVSRLCVERSVPATSPNRLP